MSNIVKLFLSNKEEIKKSLDPKSKIDQDLYKIATESRNIQHRVSAISILERSYKLNLEAEKNRRITHEF